MKDWKAMKFVSGARRTGKGKTPELRMLGSCPPPYRQVTFEALEFLNCCR